MSALPADCYYGDHHWVGGSCSWCGQRFRCICGRFMAIEKLDEHLNKDCPSVLLKRAHA